MRLTVFCFTAVSFTFVHAWAADFGSDVLPVLRRACFECHGSEKQKGGLRLDARGAALKGGEHGGVITPGKAGESELLRRIRLPRTDKDAMPKRGDALRAEEIAAIESWIARGAVWPNDTSSQKHWAYSPPKRPAVPDVPDNAWPKTDIDHFILARLEKENLHPSREADPAILVRRLSLDLTGLPPSPDLVMRYMDPAKPAPLPDASYQALVDELLKSPEFGVKWARHWLDLARYADSHGFQRDDLRDIWAFRDWVVKSLNADMPFDQFTIEQIAGDLLPNATQDQIVATGFHRCTPTNVEAGTDPEESRINQVIDRVNTTGAVWLGTTLECAQCHNHKYDPFTQRDYYSLLAYFNNTEQEADRTNPKVPGSIQFKGVPVKLADPARDAQREKFASQLAMLDQQIKAHEAQHRTTKATLAVSKPDDLPANVSPLVPTSFITESGAEFDQQDDKSLLLKGEAVPEDTYTFEAALPVGSVTGFKLEALTHSSLPGEGPGRGDAGRPNFVLQSFDATATDASGKTKPLKFASATASFSQKTFDVTNLITGAGNGSWAINPQFHQPHWAVFGLEQPLEVKSETKITLVMRQHYGGARTIGCLRLSAIRGDLAAAVPAIVETKVAAPAVVSAKKAKKNKATTEPKVEFSADPAIATLQRQRAALQKKIDALQPPSSEVMRELAAPRMSAIFKRGEFTQPGDAVTAGTPAIIDAKASGSPNRLALARWLVNRENPLTARVVVNRWWAEIFGRGIVSTVEDFGIKGEPPSHPELLDWLAVDLMENGWSMKRLIKQIVMSAAYRQRSGMEPGAKGMEIDPMNALLWRGPRFRMDAEMIRDNALAIAGVLSLEKGGPSIRPPQPDGLWKKVGGQDYKYETSPGEAQYRRGIYVVLKRGSPYPSFMNFDASQRMSCVVKRSRSNTPLQALTLLNDPVYVEAARAFAKRIEAVAGDQEQKIAGAFRIALTRLPTAKEIDVLTHLYEQQFATTRKESDAWYSVATAILNLDECITKN